MKQTNRTEKESSEVKIAEAPGGYVTGKDQSGVVAFYVLGQAGSSLGESPSKYAPFNIVLAIQAGLPVRELDYLQASLGVPMEKLFPLLGLSKATLHRRKASGKLDADESDRVVRFARLMGKAVEVMESQENARRWLNSSQIGLGGAVPLAFAKTEMGAREVEDLLGRIEYGVYS